MARSWSCGVGSVTRIHCHVCWMACTLLLSVVGSTWSYSAQIRVQQKLNHLVLDPDSGDLYVGAVNSLRRYDKDLSEEAKVDTGPKLDHPACVYPFGGTVCKDISGTVEYTAVQTDNTNKVLILDKQHSQVISCGNIFQGTCQTFNLDLTSNKSYTDHPDYKIAANTDEASTVAFLDNSALYVGTTYSGSGDSAVIRAGVPAISSRQIRGRDMFKWTAEDDLEGTATFLKLAQSALDTYLISYVTGFGTDGFSYFLTTQKESLSSDNYISKIVQVCQGDTGFKSYVEIPLVCENQDTKYNLVTSAVVATPGEQLATSLNIAVTDKMVIATFVKSDNPSSDDKGRDSAICVYELDNIRKRFQENLQRCFTGIQHNRGDQFGTSLTCLQINDYTVPVNYCGELDLNYPLAGESKLVSSPLVTFSDQPPLSSIAVDIVEQKYTVAFVGTDGGHLKKVLLSSPAQSREFADLTIDEGSPVNKDMLRSSDKKNIYVMTEYKITKVPVQECSSKMTCTDCLSHGDPYCGWCSLEKKCSIVNSCESSDRQNRWLTNKDWCIRIADYNPKQANIHHPETVMLNITSLPSQPTVQCVYKAGNAAFAESAVVTDNGRKIECRTPSDQSGLLIEEGHDHLNATLAIKSMETNQEFLETPFTLYTCSEHTRCGQCTLSKFPCHWCLYDNQCRDKSETCTQNQGSIGVGEKNKCPVLKTKSFILPSDVAQDVQISARNLPKNQPYTCVLYNGGLKVTEVQATYTGSQEVVCQDLKYVLQGSDHTQVLNLKVLWKIDHEVDGSIKNVTVYKCGNIATDCTSCMVSPHMDYNCAWCQKGGCVYRESCTNPILDTSECPQPQIISIEPTTFPIDGGTIVTITGSNIGQKRSDIIKVRIASVECDIVEYITSQKIMCRTRSVQTVKQGRLDIEYMVKGAYLQDSTILKYKNPILKMMTPSKGPGTGQTVVTITGQSLDTGSGITVMLADITCSVITQTDDTLECVKDMISDIETPTIKSDVVVKFDEAERRLPSGQSFMVHPDPVVSSINPLKTYKSGGRALTITGQYLDTVQKVLIRLVSQSKVSTPVECSMRPNMLECAYPPVPGKDNSRVKRATESYKLSLDMDGVPCVQNISVCFPTVTDQVEDFPDPKYDLFNHTRVLEGKTLTLTGQNLNLACNQNEVTVMIGETRCKVDSLQSQKLLCTPMDEKWHLESSSPVHVTVEVGNLRFNLGKLEYKDSVDQIVWIIGSAVGGGTLIFIIIIVVIVYKRRSASVERQNKKLQIQLDTLESNVRNECKQAFAELQTEVSDFTSDLNVIGIPFWDYEMYTFRVLFPGLKSHPVLHNGSDTMTKNKFGGYEQGLHQFNQLLNSKQFLLIFIRTLEQQKNFSIRDKSIVASLVMIVLQDKMEYATEILKALLNELIDKSVEKKHPKLMLRRTESVVEKLLSNWLSLSMYVYLKKHAGKMLFMLYKAIKHQTEKGPIDVFTSEAKYSLSEDKLLREKVEPKTLTLHVLMEDMKEPVTFKALDNDTVTQAKEKAVDAIYMNHPVSSRPSVHNLDLEWRSGRSGHLPLQDEDVTTQVINGWKRVNSLAHYHVADGATLVLVPSRNKNDMIRQVHGMIEISNSQSSLPPIVTIEEGTKVWHLVKHDDNQNVPRTQKVISEIFLTRLLATKGTLQQYIDDLFMTILRADHGLPPAVKYLFDFLDNAARRHNIVDPEVVHAWKSNSLPLRFWVNIIKNPEFIFDVHKSNIVDSCLSVIAQTFMDSCSTAEHKLGKDSPSNKLLFAKDIPRYRGWVSKYYKSVQDMPPISDAQITQVMTEMSMTNLTNFNVAVALQDLYKYAMQYNFELLEALDDDPSAKRLHLATRFEQVQAVIEGTPLY